MSETGGKTQHPPLQGWATSHVALQDPSSWHAVPGGHSELPVQPAHAPAEQMGVVPEHVAQPLPHASFVVLGAQLPPTQHASLQGWPPLHVGPQLPAGWHA